MTDTAKTFLRGAAVAAGALAILVAVAALSAALGRRAGVRSLTRSLVSDTVVVTIHDTSFVEVERRVVRVDTVRLPAVNLQQSVVPCDTSTTEDCSAVDYKSESTDSIAVEVPISAYLFEGEGYRIAATGYRVSLTDVWMDRTTITNTAAASKPKRWAFGVGVQVGYGYTLGGFSPYAGLGLSFGYWF